MSSTSFGSDGRRAIDRVADALSAAGRNFKVTRSGGHVHLQASCPIHGADRNPSLSVDQHAGEDRARMHCHSCDDSATERDLMEALGRHYDELWDNPGGECTRCHKRTIPLPGSGEMIHQRCADIRDGKSPRRSTQPGTAGGGVARLPAPKLYPVKPGRLPDRLAKDWPQQRRTSRSRDVAFYEHCDIDGVVLGRSVRTEAEYELTEEDGSSRLETHKGMRLDHPDTQTGGWVPRLPQAAQIPLWRPSEVAAAIAEGREVWVAEGHKDAEKLTAAGVVATTNINGAGNFNDHHAEQLRGARVVHVCDRDLAGWRRALKCARLLDGVAVLMRHVLPVPEQVKSDAYDHLDQGYTIAEFVPVTVAQLETFALVGEAEQLLSIKYLGSAIPREIQARQHRAAAAASDQERTEELRSADRWAIEAGRKLVKLSQLRLQLIDHPARTPDQIEAVEAMLVRAGEITLSAYRACGLALTDEITLALAVLDSEPAEPPTDLSTRMVPAPVSPEFPIAVSGRSDWAYSLGQDTDRVSGADRPDNGALEGVTATAGRTERGVYYRASMNHEWQRIGPLPYVTARLIRRDAADDKTGLDYLIGLTPDGPTITVTPRMLSDGSWANQLGVPLSADVQVVRAVATAIIYHADTTAPEHEGAARIDADGRIRLPPKLPTGWLEVSPAGPDQAIAAWRAIATEATPVMAHTVAASVFAPFLREIGTQPHVISLTSGKGAGKTLTLQAAAAVWGNPVADQTDLYDNWNTTAKGLPLILGSLRMLPAFRDESGMAGLTATEWGALLYTLTQGASRTRGTRDGGGTRTASWKGILFATGNGEILAGAEGGAFDGLDRRIIDFAYPTFTASREHAKRLLDEGTGQLTECYGHLGRLILERFTVARVRELLDAAGQRLAMPEGQTAREVRDLMRTHVAGAMMLDELLDTGDLLTAKTVGHATTYLSNLPDVTDGDRLLEVLLESLASAPNSWPTRAQYLTLGQSWNDQDGVQLPKSGINAGRILGVRATAENEVWVFTHKLREIAGDLNIRVGLGQLEQTGVFWRQSSTRKGQEYRSKKPLGERSVEGRLANKSVYVFRMDYLPDTTDPSDGSGPHDDEPPTHLLDEPASDKASDLVVDVGPGQPTVTTEPAGIPGSTTGIPGAIPGGIPGPNTPLTRGMSGIPGKSDQVTHEVGARNSCVDARDDQTGLMGTNQGEDQAVGFTAEQTANWGADDFDAAVTTAFDRGDWVVAEQLEALMDSRERAFRERREQRQSRRDAARDPAPASSLPSPVPTTDQVDRIESSQGSPKVVASGDAETIGISPAAPARGTGGRFAAPAAVLDATRLYLPGGQIHTWRIEHLGHLAVLAHERGGLRLGAGGGVGRLPAQGQLWLLAGALETLGLPKELRLPDEAMDRDTLRCHVGKLFAELDDHPVVAGARAAGWEITLDAWTRIRHPELLPAGAFVVFVPWQRIEDVPLIDTDNPSVLADRLAALAQRLGGVPYTIAPNVTGLALIDHTRPPRRTDDEPVDRFPAGPGRTPAKAPYRLQRGTAPDIPAFLRDRTDSRFTSLEHDWRWWRTWQPDPRKAHATLTDAERRRTFVVAYDRGGSHLSGWRTPLGAEGLRHHDRGVADGGTATWNGKDEPGLYRVKRWDTPHWGLPDPLLGCGAQVRDDHTGLETVWVTTPTLMQLRLLGVDVDVVESYTWDVTSRYLDLAVDVIKIARTDPDPAMVKMIKNIYTTTAGKFAQRDGNPNYHLARPDWWFHIVSKARFGILNTLCKINTRTGELPIAVSADAIFYTTDDPDPVSAWPGDPTVAGTRLGTDIGHWKPIGTSPLDQWAAQHLIDEPTGATFRYAKAVADLTLPDSDWLTRVPVPKIETARTNRSAQARRR